MKTRPRLILGPRWFRPISVRTAEASWRPGLSRSRDATAGRLCLSSHEEQTLVNCNPDPLRHRHPQSPRRGFTASSPVDRFLPAAPLSPACRSGYVSSPHIAPSRAPPPPCLGSLGSRIHLNHFVQLFSHELFSGIVYPVVLYFSV
jgi:hypothetical protein